MSGGGIIILNMQVLLGKIYQELWYIKAGLKDTVFVAILCSGFTNNYHPSGWLAYFL
jgi:hypothetical protein